jgi:hypothetical protein
MKKNKKKNIISPESVWKNPHKTEESDSSPQTLPLPSPSFPTLPFRDDVDLNVINLAREVYIFV